MIPKQLISQLNSGRCFALVGSGPSTAMGYPSWTKLADSAKSFLSESSIDEHTLELVKELESESRLPELFDVIADSIGGMDALARGLKGVLTPRQETSVAYRYLAKWPIRCYLTTNYDDEIQRHLRLIGVNYATLNNSQADLAQIDAYASERVVKLHGEFDFTDGLVLGQRHYQDFKVGGNRTYFRDKVKSVFSMVPVLVVGHSLTDPDISLILECAQELNSFDRPIYMLLADVSRADSRKYREQFNIHLLSYDNSDGTHGKLLRLLRQIDRFVIPRDKCARPLLDPPNADESRVASSLYIFSKGTPHRGTLIAKALGPQVLSTVATSPTDTFSVDELRRAILPEELRSDERTRAHLETAISELVTQEVVQRQTCGIQATEAGVTRHAEITRSREVLENQVFDLLGHNLRDTNAGDETEISALVDGLRNTLTAVFRQRGLAASSMLFNHSSFEPSDMPELFEAVMSSAAQVNTPELRVVFSEFVMDLLTRPTDTQREYLANLSQGFFAFHMFGADPSGAEVRRQLAQNTAWLCDSNLLLPLVAVDCHLHDFAVDLFARMKSLSMVPVTTSDFVDETLRSFRWARRNCGQGPTTLQRDAVLATIRDPNYADNLFIDGYITGAANNKWSSFDEYIQQVGIEDSTTLKETLADFGVVSLDLEQFEGYSLEEYSDLEELIGEIISKRAEQGTLRGGREQARAEAEAMQIIRGIRRGQLTIAGSKYSSAFFVSTSRLLDVMYSRTDGLITWYPENLYRHLQFLTSETLDVAHTFDALTSNYYSIGVEVIDEPAYRRFFDPVINESRVTLSREREKYEAAVLADVRGQQQAANDLLQQFEATPDLDKPRVVAQAGWFVARRETENRKSAEGRARRAEKAQLDTERRARREKKELEEEFERKRQETQRHEEGRKRNLQDPKHLKKRERQRKRRKRSKNSRRR